MMLLPWDVPVSGILRVSSPSPAVGDKPGGGDRPRAQAVAERERREPPNDFECLVKLVCSNERLSNHLEGLDLKIRRAKEYIAKVGCNRYLGDANLRYLRLKRSWTLTMLRTNRLEAGQILARIGPVMTATANT